MNLLQQLLNRLLNQKNQNKRLLPIYLLTFVQTTDL
jgi:hypothetical protein